MLESKNLQQPIVTRLEFLLGQSRGTSLFGRSGLAPRLLKWLSHHSFGKPLQKIGFEVDYERFDSCEVDTNFGGKILDQLLSNFVFKTV